MSFKDPCSDAKAIVEEVTKQLDEMIQLYEPNSSLILSTNQRENLESELIRISGHIERLNYYVGESCINYVQLMLLERDLTILQNDLKNYGKEIKASDLVRVLLNIRENLKTLLLSLPAPPSLIQPLPTPSLPPTAPVLIHVFLEESGERAIVEPPFTIGRYDPPSGSKESRLAIKKYNPHLDTGGDVLYVFNSTICQYGCVEGNINCTSRRHVDVFFRNGGLIILHQGNPLVTETYIFNREGWQPIKGRGELYLGDEVKLRISGAILENTRLPATLRLSLKAPTDTSRRTIRSGLT